MSPLKQILDTRFGGKIAYGRHDASDNKVCALELLSVKKKIPFTDEPSEVRCFDFRAINDMHVPDKLRTEWMLRMLETYEASLDWDEAKQKRVVERIIILTVNQLIADLPGLPEELANQCKAAKTLEEAETAAALVGHVPDFVRVADRANRAISCVGRNLLDSAVFAACNVVDIVRFAVAVHADLNGEAIDHSVVFIKACKLWIEAAKD